MIFTKKEHFKYEICPFESVRERAFEKLSNIYSNKDFTEGLSAYKNDENEKAHKIFEELKNAGINQPILLFLHILTEEHGIRRGSKYMHEVFGYIYDYVKNCKKKDALDSDIIIWAQYEAIKAFNIYLNTCLNLYEAGVNLKPKKTKEDLYIDYIYIKDVLEGVSVASMTFASFIQILAMEMELMREAVVQAIFYTNYINERVKKQFGKTGRLINDKITRVEKIFKEVERKNNIPCKKILKMHKELMNKYFELSTLVRSNPTDTNLEKISDLNRRLFFMEYK